MEITDRRGTGGRFSLLPLRQHVPPQAGIGQQNVDGIDQEENPQRDCRNGPRAVHPHHHSRLGGAGQVEDKGYADQHRGHGGQDIVNCELAAQGLCHLPPVKARAR